jgi:hypothetical protein
MDLLRGDSFENQDRRRRDVEAEFLDQDLICGRENLIRTVQQPILLAEPGKH